MSKVIVPKNHVYSKTIPVSGITALNIIDSIYTTNLQILPEDTDILGINATVDYGLSNSIVSVQWTTTAYKHIIIKNSVPFGCNFIILTVNNLPKIKNIGTASGDFRLRLWFDNTIIDLLTDTIAAGSTLTIPNQTYYVDLINNTVSTDPNNLAYNYNKAVICNDSYWEAPKEIYTDNSINSSYTITPKNPHPYIFNNIEFRGPNYSYASLETTLPPVSINSPTNVIININTSNNPSYIYLNLKGMAKYKNTASTSITLNLYARISGVNILIYSYPIESDHQVEIDTFGRICIDIVNKKLISTNDSDSNLKKAITHL